MRARYGSVDGWALLSRLARSLWSLTLAVAVCCGVITVFSTTDLTRPILGLIIGAFVLREADIVCRDISNERAPQEPARRYR